MPTSPNKSLNDLFKKTYNDAIVESLISPNPFLKMMGYHFSKHVEDKYFKTEQERDEWDVKYIQAKEFDNKVEDLLNG